MSNNKLLEETERKLGFSPKMRELTDDERTEFLRTYKLIEKIMIPKKRIVKFADGTKMRVKDFNSRCLYIRKRFRFVRFIKCEEQKLTVIFRDYSCKEYVNLDCVIDDLVKK